MRKHVKQLQNVSEGAVKIRCRYCELKDTCIRRERKEAHESAGITTFCTITPNRPGKKKKK